MDNWQIVLLHTRHTTLLQRAFEAAFPGRVASIYVPELAGYRKLEVSKTALVDYFKREVFQVEAWKNRVLTVYGDGDFHHWTYALTRLALERRGIGKWTYFHFDQHRDDWGESDGRGLKPRLNCGNFVDQIAHDYSATPFMVGPDAYPRKDAKGYTVCGKHIPLYHNYFTQKLQRSQRWTTNRVTTPPQTGLELPAASDLQVTPTEAYLSFDLDLLSRSEIVTNFDQNDYMTLRRVCQILDKVRPYKRIFSADILGFPDWNGHHALSCLTMIILARKIMGLGVDRLLKYHTHAKRRQAGVSNLQSHWERYWEDLLEDNERKSPIEEGELLEVLKWTR